MRVTSYCYTPVRTQQNTNDVRTENPVESVSLNSVYGKDGIILNLLYRIFNSGSL